MLDLKSFTQAIEQIADEKGIEKEKVIETIELALAAAYKRDYGQRGQIIRAALDSKTGKVKVKQIKIAVDETMIKSEEEIAAEEAERQRITEETANAAAEKEDVGRGERGFSRDSVAKEKDKDMEEENFEGVKKVRFNPEKHIMIEEARAIKSGANPGDELEFPLEYHEEFGRIAAQTAKQVIIQRIREAEREAVFEEYKDREGEVVSGLVQRIEGRNIYIDIGRTVGILPFEEQIPRERYRVGERLKCVITLVEKNPRGSGIFLSRSHPRLLKKLFEIEVPEIAAETVEIKAIAREAGSRSKVAVISHEEGVDPVGSLVGQKGVRVSAVINELGGEKIDVIEWSEDPAEFVAHALSPAKVLDVEIDMKRKSASVTVPEDELSLAIGKAGQNVRLAAKLTGWKIDVRAPRGSAVAEETEGEKEDTEKGPEGTAEEAPPSKKAEGDHVEKKNDVVESPAVEIVEGEKKSKEKSKKKTNKKVK